MKNEYQRIIGWRLLNDTLSENITITELIAIQNQNPQKELRVNIEIGYDGEHSLIIEYMVIEGEDEYNNRIKKIKTEHKLAEEQNIKNEIELYKKLKAKYELSNNP